LARRDVMSERCSKKSLRRHATAQADDNDPGSITSAPHEDQNASVTSAVLARERRRKRNTEPSFTIQY
jgi:hypothetical protein